MIVMRKLRALIKKINRSNPLRLHVLNIKSEKEITENFNHDFKILWNTTPARSLPDWYT